MDYVNKNTHDAFVSNNDGKLQRIQPGEVVSSDGAFADRLGVTPGVQTASSADKKAWEQKSSGAEPEGASSPTPSSLLNEAIVEARTAAQKLIAATNQLVVGDDQAPYGPPSGTVTTVEAVNDPEHFGHLSAAHVGKVKSAETAEGKIGGLAQPTGPEVHNSQVEAHERIADVASQLAGLHGGSEPDDGEGDDYDDLKGTELDAELEARDLPKTGTVDEKRERLREDDADDADGDADDSPSE